MYEVTEDPPLFVGGVHATTISVFSGVAVMPVGSLGAFAPVTMLTSLDIAVPPPLIVPTLKK